MGNRSATPSLLAQIGSIAFGALLFAMPARVRAANNCPLMKEATASNLVGGDTVGSFVAGQHQPSVCTFTQHAGNVTRALQISVEIINDAHGRFLSTVREDCRSKSLLVPPAIGNEAVACAVDSHRMIIGERALGRVRNQVFTITLSTPIKDDPVLTPAMLKMKIGTAAEQVTGSLF